MESRNENTDIGPSSYRSYNSDRNGSYSKFSRDYSKDHSSRDKEKNRSRSKSRERERSREKDRNRDSRDYRDSDRDRRPPYSNNSSNYRSSYGQDKERLRDFNRDRDTPRSFGNFNGGGSKFGNKEAGMNLQKIDWSQVELTPFQKNFYTENSTVKDRSQSDIDKFREEHQITIKSSYAPRPIFAFEEAQFPSYISDQLTSRFKTPSPIQSQGWPAAMGGNDVIGIAQTGSGKTISFLLPGFVHINAQPSLRYGDGPIMLVLAPTRELAMQIQEECLKFSRSAKIYSTCVYGGADKWGQKRELQKGNHVIVATPGRLLDFLESGVINLKRVTYLVLDEADRMLDMGFEPQIRKIVSQIRPDRQTLMWSATWPREVQKLALEFCREKPVHIVIGSNNLSVNLKIKQNVEVLDDSMKQMRVVQLVQTVMNGSKILIFTQTKKGADQLSYFLGNSGISAASIHGDKTQAQRDYIMRQYKTGRTNILVATDLAARGLDVADILYVINYDFPTNIEDYVHRVGRTGRGGREGVSYTFFSRGDYKHSYKLIDMLEENDQVVPDELYRMARRPIPRKSNGGYGNNNSSYSKYPSHQSNHTSYSNHSGNQYNSHSQFQYKSNMPPQQYQAYSHYQMPQQSYVPTQNYMVPVNVEKIAPVN